MNRFIDREGLDLNKKILDVTSVERNEAGEIIRLYVKEIRNDSEVTVEGTPLNAENMNTIIRNIANECIDVYHTSREEEIKVEEAKADLHLGTEVYDFLNLPQTGSNNTTITWSVVLGTGIEISSNTAVVTRETSNQTVVLLATITYGNASSTKSFTITVIARTMTDEEKVEEDKADLYLDAEVDSDFSLPQTGANNTTITWSVISGTGIEISGETALVTQGADDQTVELQATITKGNASSSKSFNITVLGNSTTSFTYEISGQYVQWESNSGIDQSAYVIISTEENQNMNVVISNSYPYFEMTVQNNNTTNVLIDICESLTNKPDLTMQSIYEYEIFIYDANDIQLAYKVGSISYN